MAMIGELFAGFDSLKALVEKISEAFEKMSDEKDVMVCWCTITPNIRLRI